MLVHDHPTWGWIEATDVSDRTQRAKKAWDKRLIFIFWRLQVYPLSQEG